MALLSYYKISGESSVIPTAGAIFHQLCRNKELKLVLLDGLYFLGTSQQEVMVICFFGWLSLFTQLFSLTHFIINLIYFIEHVLNNMLNTGNTHE